MTAQQLVERDTADLCEMRELDLADAGPEGGGRQLRERVEVFTCGGAGGSARFAVGLDAGSQVAGHAVSVQHWTPPTECCTVLNMYRAVHAKEPHMTATATRTELTVAQIEAIWHAADGTGLLCPDTQAVVVNWRSGFGYLAFNRYATMRSARKAAERCAGRPEFRETYVVTRGRGDSLEIEAVTA